MTRDSLGRSEMTHDWNATPVRYMLPALSGRGARMADMINLDGSGSPFFTFFPHGGNDDGYDLGKKSVNTGTVGT